MVCRGLHSLQLPTSKKIDSKQKFYHNLGVYRKNITILLCPFTVLVQNNNLLCKHGWQCTMVTS